MDRILNYLFLQAPAQYYSIPLMSINKNSAYFIVKHHQLTEKHLHYLILHTRMIISEMCFITQFHRALWHLPPLNLLQSMTSSHISVYAHLIHNLPVSRNSLKSGSTPRMGCAAVRFKYRSNDALRFSTNSADEPCSAWFDIFIFVIPVNIDQTPYKVQIHYFFLSILWILNTKFCRLKTKENTFLKLDTSLWPMDDFKTLDINVYSKVYTFMSQCPCPCSWGGLNVIHCLLQQITAVQEKSMVIIYHSFLAKMSWVKQYLTIADHSIMIVQMHMQCCPKKTSLFHVILF